VVMDRVGLTAWIGTLQRGLNQDVGPGGSRLSGGQRQRLAIGRAILQRPRILILDEATSSLDSASEQQLLSSLPSLLPGTTLIVISHRLSALLCADRVIVLEAGRVVEDASPALLLRNGGAYSRLFNSVRPRVCDRAVFLGGGP
jgi:ABC-type multidrug transport system fused ATPase/permease subunit